MKKHRQKQTGAATLALYKDSKGNIEFRADAEKETIWASLDQIAESDPKEKDTMVTLVTNLIFS